MIFIRKEKVLHTICNKQILDTETIKQILSSLEKESISFNLVISVEINYVRTGKEYQRVKVLQVNNDSADFICFNNDSTEKIRNISLTDIKKISAISSSSIDCVSDIQEVSRASFYDFLD